MMVWLERRWGLLLISAGAVVGIPGTIKRNKR